MATKTFFVTGTDTEVGKTLVSAAILGMARQRGLRCEGIKPVAAGCRWQDGRLVNDDALALMSASDTNLDYQSVNPIALEPPIAPHIAAAKVGRTLEVESLAAACREILQGDLDLAVIEGAGGWLVPLNDRDTLADLCAALEATVILVVAMKLGCINHALLTAKAIAELKLEFAGWVGNCVGEEMPCLHENIATLQGGLQAPCLGILPHIDDALPQSAWRHLQIEHLLT